MLFDLLPHLICYDNEPTPPVDPPVDPPADPPADPPLLTQEQFNKALAEDRRKHKAQLEKVERQYAELLQSKRLTDDERTKLEEAREDLLKQMRTKEEQAKYELKQKEAEYTNKLTAAEKKAQEFQKRYEDFKIERALLDAAMPDAINPYQFVKLFRNDAKFAADGTETVVVNFEDEIEEPDGTKRREVSQATPEKAIERMKQLPHIHGNLFKSTNVGGIGGTGKPELGKALSISDIRKMTPEQYAANRQRVLEQLRNR